MIIRLLRKMLNNKWMVSCLLIGFVLSVAMVSSIPVYTDGVLQRMLIKDLENFQLSSKKYPGLYNLNWPSYGVKKETNLGSYNAISGMFDGSINSEVGLPILSQTRVLVNNGLLAQAEKTEDTKTGKAASIAALENFKDHIKITDGREFSTSKAGDTYEAVVNVQAMKRLELVVGKEIYLYSLKDLKLEPIKVKVVGVFTPKDENDPYWNSEVYGLANSFVIDASLFKGDYMKEAASNITDMQWVTMYDYHKISIKTLDSMSSSIEAQVKWFKTRITIAPDVPSLPILKQYSGRASQLKMILWILQVPILLMLAFYLFMVSQLLIDQEKNEIAVVKSRGASGMQIFNTYLMEGIVLSILSLILGPVLGLGLCEVLGASNGFMEFVQRSALPISLSGTAYQYSLYAVAIFIAAVLVPVAFATRTTIVQHKQKKARLSQKPLWQKLFLDVILLAATIYGLNTYKSRQSILSITGAKASDLPIDPILFLITTFFIIGAGLLFLRIFPYIVRIIFKIGERFWSPAIYTSLLSVGRSGGKDRFLMLFLILTISLGLFNANAARTINSNMEEKVRYSVGADITLMSPWDNNKPPRPAPVPGAAQESSSSSNSGTTNGQIILYKEPPFSQYTGLPGVESVTKVFTNDKSIFQCNGKSSSSSGYLMGIIPGEFGRTAWFRSDLLKTHWYRYLNLLAMDPRALLVSRSFQKKYNAKIGDEVTVVWGNWQFQGIIFEFVDYWPTYSPYGSDGELYNRDLVVANLSYIQAVNAIEPYKVWMKKKPGVTSQEVYNQLKERNVRVTQLNDASQQIIAKKNDPMVQGTNGALTLSFVITMIVSSIGFLIYWILSIKSRTLQFGILRAMGVSFREIVDMLFGEQLLISGVSIIVGICIGGLASDLFVPLLQMVYSATEQVPPFRVIASRSDYLKLYTIVGIMLAAGILALARMISKINISQALKLGED